MNNIRSSRAAARAAAVEFAIALATTIGAALAVRLVAGSWDLAFAQGLLIGIVSLMRRIVARSRGIDGPGMLQQPAGSVAGHPMTRWGAPWLPARISVSTGTLLIMMVLLYLSASTVSALAVGLAVGLVLAPPTAFWTVCGLSAGAVVIVAGLRVRKLLSVSLLLVHKAFPIEHPRSPS